MREGEVTFQFLSGVGTWFLVWVICVLRDVKRLILLAKSLSASSCSYTVQRSPPVRRSSRPYSWTKSVT
jgi:hypothetical protein